MPVTIKIASWMWLIFGSLMIVSAMVSGVMFLSRDIAGIALLGVLIPLLLGSYYFWAGWRTLKGKAKGVLASAINSLLLGALAAYSFDKDPAVHSFFAAVFFSSGLLALSGQSGYRKFISAK